MEAGGPERGGQRWSVRSDLTVPDFPAERHGGAAAGERGGGFRFRDRGERNHESRWNVPDRWRSSRRLLRVRASAAEACSSTRRDYTGEYRASQGRAGFAISCKYRIRDAILPWDAR